MNEVVGLPTFEEIAAEEASEKREQALRRIRLKVTLALAVLNFGNGRWWRINELPDVNELAALVLDVVESHGELI